MYINKFIYYYLYITIYICIYIIIITRYLLSVELIDDAFKFRNNFNSDPAEVNKAQSNQRLGQTLLPSNLS